MKKKVILSLLVLFIGAGSVYAQTEQEQRIQASYMLAFGRQPNSGELTYWKSQGNKSISELINNHKGYLKQDAATQRNTINKAYADAMGRNASESEISYWKSGNDTYTTLMKNHVSWLANNPAEYEKVIKRSYQFVFGRPATAAEVNYWKGQPKVSYILLVAYHQDYKKRNQASQSSGLNVRNAGSLVSVPLSANIAAEASAATGLSKNNVVAAGGDNLIAPSGGYVVAAGGANVVAAGGLN